MAINGVTTTIVNGIISCLPSNVRFIRGKRIFPKPVGGKFAKTSILPTTCFKKFLCSSRLASTFGKSLSDVFVASLNSAWRDVESVLTVISHFSLWSKTLHCWQKLSKSINQRVYQDLVYRNALLLKILTSVPAPLSPVPLYFSSLSLLRTALDYLNAWNRLMSMGLCPTRAREPRYEYGALSHARFAREGAPALQLPPIFQFYIQFILLAGN